MKKLNYYGLMNKTNYAKKIKFIYIILILSLISLFICFEYFRYNQLINNFRTNFKDYNYAEANNLIITNEQYNPIKILKLKDDLTVFFDSEISELSDEMKNNNTPDENVLLELNEIQRYNLISSDKISEIADSSSLLKSSTANYNNGISCFSNEDYVNSISYFEKVSSLDLNYTSSLKYINESRENIKLNIFEYCDELVENDYYSKAISTLEENSSLIKNTDDIQNKISEIKNKQLAYYNKNTEIAEASSKALICDITPNTINELDIESNTSYFLDVDLNNQKTYVYKGKKNKWSLLKTFSCSTGISGKETPVGSFTTQEKGDWFFSNKYNQGGKYWTQIVGDILFHSVPFDNNKTTILDNTLNQPSSHGCIRLSISDSKWIYDNIPKGSKVIIK